MQSLDLSLNRRRLHFRHFNPLMCRSPFCRVYRPTGYVAASVSCVLRPMSLCQPNPLYLLFFFIFAACLFFASVYRGGGGGGIESCERGSNSWEWASAELIVCGVNIWRLAPTDSARNADRCTEKKYENCIRKTLFKTAINRRANEKTLSRDFLSYIS